MAPVVTADELRRHLLDFPDTNLPLRVQHLEDEDLDDCIEHAVDDFNNSTPILKMHQYTVDNFPFKSILLSGAIIEALERTVFKEMRGEMNYNDGGVQNALWYKAPQFNQAKNELAAEYEKNKLKIKRQLNMQTAFGGA